MGYRITQIPAHETWPLRHTVMWPDKPLDYVRLPEDEHGIHYGLFVNERLVSVISLFITGEIAQFRKFATDTTEQGKGYGSLLLQHLIDQTKLKGIQKLWCNARVDKVDLYKRFGMTTTEETFQKGGIEYVVMTVGFA